jgi:predicted  nucleic acid-binding Zn-ribbon protein
MNSALKELVKLRDLTRQYENENHATNLRKKIDSLRDTLPKNFLRRFDHLAEHGRLPVAEISESGACESCHMKLPPADALKIRSSSHSLSLPTCPFCGCFLYFPAVLSQSKELMEAGS